MNPFPVTDISWQHLQQRNQLLPRRSLNSHKGDHGHVQVIGGDYGYAGAALMASQAALSSGAGLVSCLTRPEHVSAYISRCPEIMVSGIHSGLELMPFLSTETRANTNKVVVVGPGLGKKAYGQLLLQTVFQQVQKSDKPITMVLDADGLNLLAEKPLMTGCELDFNKHHVVLTPHPAEAARLLNSTVDAVQLDRVAAVKKLAERYACTVILKGQHSLIAGLDENNQMKIHRCLDGNPAMAVGGMGDILSGILGAVLAQGQCSGLSLLEAVLLACCVHSKAADDASLREGEIGLLATDLLPYVRRVIQVQASNEI